MTRHLLAATMLAVAVLTACTEAPTDTAVIPERADNFLLPDHTGFGVELHRMKDADAIVLASHVTNDPTSDEAATALAALQEQHPNVEFFLIDSSLEDTRAEIAASADAKGLSVAVLDDSLQLIGESLGVTHSGQAFVISPANWSIVYAGPADERLASALASHLAGEPIADRIVAASGSSIAFPERQAQAEHVNISYTDDIAPILEARCVSCHQTGGIGPFAMTDYAVVKGFAPMIREAVRTGRMPPWHPDPEVGAFKHDYSLSAEQKRTLVHWIEAGAPRGEGDDPLARIQHASTEWPLGEPDLTIDIPTYQVPASGVIEYQYPSVALPTNKGRWVRASTLMPGDRQAVHHILAGYMSEAPPSGRSTSGSWEASYGEYAVGGESFTVPDGLGIYLPPEGLMGFQMHYTAYGKAAADDSRMALYFYPEDEEPEFIMHHKVIGDTFIELPPNTDRHTEVAYAAFDHDATLYSVFLHTHIRGQSARFDLILPDGEKQTLINLPRYDFNWQRTYEFAEPIAIPAGSKLVSTYTYDNSIRNPVNPDPNERVIWGDQTFEEMHYTSIYYRWMDETVADPLEDESTRLGGRLNLLAMLDDNLDEKIQLAELRGHLIPRLTPLFAEYDTDGDGGLTDLEFATLMRASGTTVGFGSSAGSR